MTEHHRPAPEAGDTLVLLGPARQAPQVTAGDTAEDLGAGERQEAAGRIEEPLRQGVADRGGITMNEPEAVISAAADHAQAEILTPEIDTIVWEEVAARTSDDSAFSLSFRVLMVLAGIIAAIAVVTNNPVLVVGAMIVSPDYGPMAALSVALVNRARRQAWQSFRALALGFPLAALAALPYTLAARGLGRIPGPYLAGQRPLTGLLIGANLGAFVVAFVAGAAGSSPWVGPSRARWWGCWCRSPRSLLPPTSG